MLASTSVYFSESGLSNGLRPIRVKKSPASGSPPTGRGLNSSHCARRSLWRSPLRHESKIYSTDLLIWQIIAKTLAALSADHERIRPPCMDGPRFARVRLGDGGWTGAVMYSAFGCGPWPRATMGVADRVPSMATRLVGAIRNGFSRPVACPKAPPAASLRSREGNSNFACLSLGLYAVGLRRGA
jgi:hypothetical protein